MAPVRRFLSEDRRKAEMFYITMKPHRGLTKEGKRWKGMVVVAVEWV